MSAWCLPMEHGRTDQAGTSQYPASRHKVPKAPAAPLLQTSLAGEAREHKLVGFEFCNDACFGAFVTMPRLNGEATFP